MVFLTYLAHWSRKGNNSRLSFCYHHWKTPWLEVHSMYTTWFRSFFVVLGQSSSFLRVQYLAPSVVPNLCLHTKNSVYMLASLWTISQDISFLIPMPCIFTSFYRDEHILILPVIYLNITTISVILDFEIPFFHFNFLSHLLLFASFFLNFVFMVSIPYTSPCSPRVLSLP